MFIYYKRLRGAAKLSELPDGDLKELLPLISLGEFELMFQPEANFLPHFREYEIYEQPFSQRDVSASIAWYFLAADASQISTKPSVERAHNTSGVYF